MFSQADCEFFRNFPSVYSDLVCKNNSMLYATDPELLEYFTRCIIRHFMTEMGACSNASVRSDIDTSVKNTAPLLTKHRLFYSFLVHTLNAGNICQATNDTCTTVAFSLNSYNDYTSSIHRGERECTYDTPEIDRGRQRYYDCFHYRFLKSLNADSVVKTGH